MDVNTDISDTARVVDVITAALVVDVNTDISDTARVVDVITAALVVDVNTDISDTARVVDVAVVAGHVATKSAYRLRAALLAASAGAIRGCTTTNVGSSSVFAGDDAILCMVPTASTTVSSTVRVASTVVVDSAMSSSVTCVSTVSISCCRCL